MGRLRTSMRPRGRYLWGECERCKTIARLLLDHCHLHNQIRGLLCNLCNSRTLAIADKEQSIEEQWRKKCGPCFGQPMDIDAIYSQPYIPKIKKDANAPSGWRTGKDAYRKWWMITHVDTWMEEACKSINENACKYRHMTIHDWRPYRRLSINGDPMPELAATS